MVGEEMTGNRKNLNHQGTTMPCPTGKWGCGKAGRYSSDMETDEAPHEF